MMYDVYWYCQMKKNEWLWKFWKRNDYENFEQKGGRRKRNPCPMAPVVFVTLWWCLHQHNSQVGFHLLVHWNIKLQTETVYICRSTINFHTLGQPVFNAFSFTLCIAAKHAQQLSPSSALIMTQHGVSRSPVVNIDRIMEKYRHKLFRRGDWCCWRGYMGRSSRKLIMGYTTERVTFKNWSFWKRQEVLLCMNFRLLCPFLTMSLRTNVELKSSGLPRQTSRGRVSGQLGTWTSRYWTYATFRYSVLDILVLNERQIGTSKEIIILLN